MNPNENTCNHLNGFGGKIRMNDFFQTVGINVVFQNWNIKYNVGVHCEKRETNNR
jgi:hypothetical protein